MKGKVKSILVVVVKRRDRADGLFAASLASVPLVYNPRNSNIFSSLVFGFHRYVFELENIVLEACNVSWLRVTREKINIYRLKEKMFIQNEQKTDHSSKLILKWNQSIIIKAHVVRTSLPFKELISNMLHKQLSSLVTTLLFRYRLNAHF